MQQDVIFRGTKDGLLVVLNDEPDFAVVMSSLAEKLATTGHFFRGAEVMVAVGHRLLSPEQRRQVGDLLTGHGLILRQFREGEALAEVLGRVPAPRGSRGVPEAGGPTSEGSTPVADMTAAATLTLCVREQPPLILNRTLRSGQAIRHRGDVVIIGDVNPGAEVVATGHIIVLGSLRGVAHAGATGDETALVMAVKFQPSQLRIGHRVGRPPDGEPPGEAQAEVARVVDGQIVIEGRAEK